MELGLGLFRMNKVVGREACSFFYSRNCFDLMHQAECRSAGWKSEAPPSLVKEIGPSNASCIQHIRIGCPEFSASETGDVTLTENKIAGIATIQSRCPNIKTIRVPASLNPDLHILANAHRGIIAKALSLLDPLLRASPLLQDIIVEGNIFYTGEFFLSSEGVREEIKKLGWKLVMKEKIARKPRMNLF